MDKKEIIFQLLSKDGCGTLPYEQIHDDQNMYDIGFDSLRYMEFIVLLEETLEITVPDEMLDIRADVTLKDIVTMVSHAEA
ncbi:acyl carrier protein [Longirhabdus pacifica]|uniref:acyl carrier protein n=1 Tax=Longirhabdus pacifica TaxID=2305227 RepID=UPI0010087DBE|nr:acyl carrier protein [Longirhabdus pacifica]